MIEGIKDYEIYLAPCKEMCYNKANKLENHLAMFTCKSYEEMRKFADNDKEALCVVQELEKLSQEKYFGVLYDASIVQKKLENSAKDEGIKQGIKKGVIQTAKLMLKDNIDIATISKYTQLTNKETNDLKGK